jgi:hypothetical protein
MGWFDIIKNLSAEEQRKLLEDLNAPNTEKPPPMPNMTAKTFAQMTDTERREAAMRGAGIKPKQPKLPFGVGENPNTTRPAPDLPPMPTTGKKPLKPLSSDRMLSAKDRNMTRVASELQLGSVLSEYNQMPFKTEAQKAKKRAFAQKPEMKRISQGASQIAMGSYKQPVDSRTKTLGAGKRLFGGGPTRGPPTGDRRLSDRVREQLKNKEEAGKRVQSVVEPPVEERQSQKDEVARRIQEERKKREETLARNRAQREPAGSVKDARRARIAASSSGGLPTGR